MESASDAAAASAVAETGPRYMDPWLWVIYPLAFGSMSLVWGGVLQVLLGKQIAAIVPSASGSAAALGIVMSLGAISGVAAQPILGWLSDRTPPGALGRRNSWVLGASIVGGVGLVVMSTMTSVLAVAITYFIVLWPLSGVQAALSAVLPERVPVKLRGTISGLLGAATALGSFSGVAIAGLSPQLFVGYLGIAGVFVMIAGVFAITTKDHAVGTNVGSQGSNPLPSFRNAPDYWYAFAGRFLIIFGYFSVVSFQLYILRDHIRVGNTDSAARLLVELGALGAALHVASSLLGGWLSDRFKRLRIFVALSSLLFVPAALTYLLVPTVSGAWVATGIMGIAFGTYLAVDQALIAQVLPSPENAARDLGIMNIANSGPQIIAPALVGAVIGLTGDYRLVFVTLIISTVLGAISVYFIKGVR